MALEIAAPLRQALVQRIEAERRRFPPARWVRPENLHLTLSFLGEVEESVLPELDHQLRAACAARRSVEVSLTSPGTFPPRRPARVVWLGVDAHEDLLALQRDVETVCTRVVPGAREARSYRPHLTVARCRKPWPVAETIEWQQALDDLSGKGFLAEQGTLFSSTLGSDGARHAPVGVYPLGAPE